MSVVDNTCIGFNIFRSKPPSSVGNFVKLNMKVKTYKRKGKGMTGPQYKRFQWKQKMKSRSASYGNNCFKCGKPGHWANKCPSKHQFVVQCVIYTVSLYRHEMVESLIYDWTIFMFIWYQIETLFQSMNLLLFLYFVVSLFLLFSKKNQ